MKHAKHKSNLDIMLLTIRAITYRCNVFSRSSGFLSRHGVISALCERLMAIEYSDVAEQCLQAWENISQDQPLACLQSGAIKAVLDYIVLLLHYCAESCTIYRSKLKKDSVHLFVKHIKTEYLTTELLDSRVLPTSKKLTAA